MHDSFNQHILHQFDQDLEALRAKLLAMGGLVEQQLNDALKSLIELDVGLAKHVINAEFEVNNCEVAIDKKCIHVLACHHPAAKDLRLVMVMIKTTNDLERIGDEAQKIAKMAVEFAERKGLSAHYAGINVMGNLVCKMVHDALDTFTRMDPKAALAVASEEPESDEQYATILRQLTTYMMEDPKSITDSIGVIWVARALERIADHARNVCENVIYFAQGKDVRHISIKEMKKELGV